MKTVSQVLGSLAVAAALFLPAQAEPTSFDSLLQQGQVSLAKSTLEKDLLAHPGDHRLRFQLGLSHFLAASESCSQSMYRLGLEPSQVGQLVGILHLPVGINPEPQPVSNQSLRKVLADFKDGLDSTSQILAGIPDGSDVKFPVKIGQIRLDLNGDGQCSLEESFGRVLDRMTGIAYATDAPPLGELEGHFDVADARWLEGYCHLVSGLLEIVLAYDTQKLFDHGAHLLFARPESGYPFLTTGQGSDWGFVDFAALAHSIDLPLLEPARLKASLAHFQQVTALSRRCWSCILAERDDDLEWLPGPTQHSFWQRATVTPEMVTSWQEFLDEADLILEGKRLLPFWRTLKGFEAQRGVNLRRVFLEPTRLDAVYWLQGTAAVPYLESGSLTDEKFWNDLSRVFRGNFFGFAIWFN